MIVKFPAVQRILHVEPQHHSYVIFRREVTDRVFEIVADGIHYPCELVCVDMIYAMQQQMGEDIK